MRRGLKRAKATRGLTLLELVVAVFILSLGSIAALRATDQSRVSIGGMPDRVLAQLVARNRVQELQLYGALHSDSLPGEVEMGGRRFSVSQSKSATAAGLVEVAITVHGPGGPGAYLMAYVPQLGPGS